VVKIKKNRQQLHVAGSSSRLSCGVRNYSGFYFTRF